MYTLSTNKSWSQTMADLKETMRLWKIREWDAHTNFPRSARDRYTTEEERKVILRYKKDNKEIYLEIGKQARPEDNLRVLYLAVEAMRMNEKRGIDNVIKNAYLQIEAPVQQKNPYEVLGIYDTSTLEEAEAMYRIKAKKAHPDSGGSPEKMKELIDAIERIRQIKK